MIFSTPQAMLAISSLRNRTSSTGSFSKLLSNAGGSRNKLGSSTVVAVPVCGGDESWNIRQEANGSPASWDERIRKRSPKVLVTISERGRQTEPTGNSSGITNQSFP